MKSFFGRRLWGIDRFSLCNSWWKKQQKKRLFNSTLWKRLSGTYIHLFIYQSEIVKDEDNWCAISALRSSIIIGALGNLKKKKRFENEMIGQALNYTVHKSHLNPVVLIYVVSSLGVKLPGNIHPLWNHRVSLLDHTGWQDWHRAGKHYLCTVLMDLLNSWNLTCVFQWIKVSGATNQRLG